MGRFSNIFGQKTPSADDLQKELSLDPAQASTPEEAARRSQVMEDGMAAAAGSIGGGAEAAEGLLAKITQKAAAGERLTAAEQILMNKAKDPWQATHVVDSLAENSNAPKGRFGKVLFRP